MVDTKRNRAVDIAKYIAALLIVAIHTDLFHDVSAPLYFIVVQVICRFAVPFFAVCTGYFLSARMEYKPGGGIEKSENNQSVLKHQFKKLVVLYIVFSILYLFFSIPKWIETGWFSANAFLDYTIGAVLSGSYFHLWYLLCVIYALPMFYFCLRAIKPSWSMFVAIVLYLIRVAMYAYRPWMPAGVVSIFELLDKAGALITALVGILPFFLMGNYIFLHNKKACKTDVIGLIASITLLTVEAVLLAKSGQASVSYIIFTFPTAYFLFRVLKDIPIGVSAKTAQLLGAASMMVYCCHPMIVELNAKWINSTVLNFLATSICATLVAVVYVRCVKSIKMRRSKSA